MAFVRFIRVTTVLISVSALLCVGFGIWGCYTNSGTRQFRADAIIIPAASLDIGLCLFSVLIVLLSFMLFLQKLK